MIAGLLGEKLSHSYSPYIHSHFADYEYKLFEVEKESVRCFLRSGRFDALNVTIPYKKIAFEEADVLSDIARRIGSVNTVVRKSGKLYATNTDYYGFKMLFDSLDVKSRAKALILGTGGASLAVKAVLEDVGFEKIVFISRSSPDNNYDNISIHDDASIVVNTTPVGMYPENMKSPINDLSIFKSLEAVIDIIYNPRRTKLMQDAEKMGVKSAGGLLMLVAQAAESSFHFTSKRVPQEQIGYVLDKLEKNMCNIVLIGMPGCGKSTVGNFLATSLSRKFIDTDLEFEKKYKLSPRDCIVNYSEDYFRDREQEIVSNISKSSNCVISTGGGAVERESNYQHLHQNSNIVYIKRDLKELSRSDRPLSSNLEALFQKREKLYRQFADFEVLNNTTYQQCAQDIIDLLA